MVRPRGPISPFVTRLTSITNEMVAGAPPIERVLPAFRDFLGDAVLVAHNAQFDVSILSWKYGVQPAFILDTLSMARALRGIEVGNSLAKLADEFGLPPKGKGLSHRARAFLKLAAACLQRAR